LCPFLTSLTPKSFPVHISFSRAPSGPSYE
jgi:hypothetical protein